LRAVRGGDRAASRCRSARRGFTKFSRDDYVQWKKDGRLMNDGVNAKVRSCSGRPVCDPCTQCLAQPAGEAAGCLALLLVPVRLCCFRRLRWAARLFVTVRRARFDV
jgi:hypothetical protein